MSPPSKRALSIAVDIMDAYEAGIASGTSIASLTEVVESMIARAIDEETQKAIANAVRPLLTVLRACAVAGCTRAVPCAQHYSDRTLWCGPCQADALANVNEAQKREP